MKKVPLMVFILAGFVSGISVKAQSVGDYRTIASGNWDSASIWQRYNGDWVAAVTPPTEAAGIITIRTGDTVISDRNRTADELVVATGGILHLAVFSGTAGLLLHNGPGIDLLCNGQLVIDGNAALNQDTLIGGSQIKFTADSLKLSGGIGPQFTFNGTGPQVIASNGSGYMGEVVLDNPSNLEITASTSFQKVVFVNGKINVTGTGSLVVTQYSAGFAGQNNTRFIDGMVTCIIYVKNSAIPFSLPMGKGNDYLPIDFTVTQDADMQTNFAFTIKDGAPAARTLPSTLKNVSSVRYYTITKIGDANITDATVKLSYNASDAVSDPSHLRIAKSNGGQWVDLGGMGTGSPDGTILSTVNFTTFSDFVLANDINGGNVLPLNITSFRLTQQGTSVSLFWKAEDESNTDYYEVERRDSDNNRKVIATIKANGNGNYSFTDDLYKSPGLYEYQVKQVNKDGKVFYSKQLSAKVQNFVGKLSIAQLFPNPANALLNYLAVCEHNNLLTVSVTGINGRLIRKQESKANQLATISLNNVASGNYLLTIYNKTTGEKITKEFIKK